MKRCSILFFFSLSAEILYSRPPDPQKAKSILFRWEQNHDWCEGEFFSPADVDAVERRTFFSLDNEEIEAVLTENLETLITTQKRTPQGLFIEYTTVYQKNIFIFPRLAIAAVARIIELVDKNFLTFGADVELFLAENFFQILNVSMSYQFLQNKAFGDLVWKLPTWLGNRASIKVLPAILAQYKSVLETIPEKGSQNNLNLRIARQLDSNFVEAKPIISAPVNLSAWTKKPKRNGFYYDIGTDGHCEMDPWFESQLAKSRQGLMRFQSSRYPYENRDFVKNAESLMYQIIFRHKVFRFFASSKVDERLAYEVFLELRELHRYGIHRYGLSPEGRKLLILRQWAHSEASQWQVEAWSFRAFLHRDFPERTPYNKFKSRLNFARVFDSESIAKKNFIRDFLDTYLYSKKTPNDSETDLLFSEPSEFETPLELNSSEISEAHIVLDLLIQTSYIAVERLGTSVSLFENMPLIFDFVTHEEQDFKVENGLISQFHLLFKIAFIWEDWIVHLNQMKGQSGIPCTEAILEKMNKTHPSVFKFLEKVTRNEIVLERIEAMRTWD